MTGSFVTSVIVGGNTPRLLAALVLLGAGSTSGCRGSDAPSPSTARDVGRADSGAKGASNVAAAEVEALREAWRASVKYRSGKSALARNAPQIERDVDKVRRMLAEVEAPRRVPVVTDVPGDRAVVEAELRVWVSARRVTGAEVEVGVAAAAPEPPRHASTDSPLRYDDAQLAGAHPVEITLPEGLVHGPALVGALPELPRLLILDGAVLEAGGRVRLSGGVWFFRDLSPAEFAVPQVDAEALIAAATTGAAASAETQGLARKIRENYRAVDELSEGLDSALRASARFQIEDGRFRLFARLVERFNAVRWRGLIDGGPPSR